MLRAGPVAGTQNVGEKQRDLGGNAGTAFGQGLGPSALVQLRGLEPGI